MRELLCRLLMGFSSRFSGELMEGAGRLMRNSLGDALGGFDEGGELLGGGRPAGVEAHLLVDLAVGDGPVTDERGAVGVAAIVFKGEDDGHEGLVGRLDRKSV